MFEIKQLCLVIGIIFFIIGLKNLGQFNNVIIF